MATRSTHAVRIKDQATGQWVDVRVLDVLVVKGPNGDERAFDCGVKHAAPRIIDDTGDGNDKSERNPSRVSHMVRVTHATNPNQALDIEVLDAFAVKGPNGDESAFDMRSKNAVAVVEDNTDMGLSAEPQDPTRHSHMKKITQASGNSAQGTSDPAGPGPFLAVEIMDAVNFRTTNGDENALVGFQSTDADKGNWRDTTLYTTNDEDREPPLIENSADVNHYVKFVKGPNGRLAGPWVGKNPKYGDDTKNGGTNQGLLWWIEDAGQPGPWWAWPPEQQPYDISGLGGPCFQRTTTVGFIHILAIAPWVLIPIEAVLGGPVGYPTLDDATAAGFGATTGWFGTATNNISQLDFTQPPGNDLLNTGNIFDYAAGRLTPTNIWQKLGEKQPMDVHGNPVMPSDKHARRIAKKWRDLWNITSLAWNGNVAGGLCNGSNPANNVFWPYAIPIGDAFSFSSIHAFSAGLPIQWRRAGGPVWSGAWAITIEVGQLDPTKWDTSGIYPTLWTDE